MEYFSRSISGKLVTYGQRVTQIISSPVTYPKFDFFLVGLAQDGDLLLFAMYGRGTKNDRSVCAKVSCHMVPKVVAPEFPSNQEARFTIWTSAKMRCILAIVPTVSALFAPPGPNPLFIPQRISPGHRLIIVFHFVFFDGEHSPMMVPTSWYSGAAFSPTERYLEINM